MLPLLTAATARELLAALPQESQVDLLAGAGLAADAERIAHAGQAAAAPLPRAELSAPYSRTPQQPADQLQEQCVYAVRLAGQPWLACITGVGPINAAFAMGLTLARFPAITAVLNVGLAGTFDLTRAPLGSTIAVNQEIWPEYGLADATGVDAAGLGFPLWAKEGIVDRLPLSTDPGPMGLPPLPLAPPFPLAATGPGGVSPSAVRKAGADFAAPVGQGSALTVAGVTNSAERALRLQHRYAALIENMEGFAVALACARHRIPLLELRTISNVTGSRLPQDRDFPRAFSAMNLFFTTYFTPSQ